VDPITALLDGPRARGAFVLRCLLEPPWSMAVRDEAPLTVVAVTRGEAWITQHGTAVHLPEGSVALVVGPEHYEVTSTPGRAADVIIHPGQRCETPSGESLELSMRLGVRSWGHARSATSTLLVGTYEDATSLRSEVLATLTSPAVVSFGDGDPLLALLARELSRDLPGQQTLLDRLLDALAVDALRRWCAEHPDQAPPWWDGHRDPVVGEALRLLHDDPAHPWTIAEVASRIGTSRASLSRRFTDLVGEGVITYLTRWRLGLAADLLAEPGRSIGEVAAEVGYGSPFALSTAFKRRYGISPNHHRQAIRAAETTT
jgi:AraC-like DNA-binding protein